MRVCVVAQKRKNTLLPVRCELDHLVLGADTLEQGADFIEALLGARPQTGGRHLDMGTHNLLLKLGAKSYLEVIAIDPDGAAPPRPRWFGLDAAPTRAALRERPRLLTWVARTENIEAAVRDCPQKLGAVERKRRGAYSWRITVTADGALPGDGITPALIEWESDAHPADKLNDCGCELMKLAGTHPAPARITPALVPLGLDHVLSLATADRSRLIATIRGARGICNLMS